MTSLLGTCNCGAVRVDIADRTGVDEAGMVICREYRERGGTVVQLCGGLELTGRLHDVSQVLWCHVSLQCALP